MSVRYAIASGTWSNTSTWNDGATLGIPTVGDDVWANGFTVVMDVNATVTSLNNNARSRDIATPLMTSNIIPSPYVAAASSLADGSQPFQAFDRSTGTQWSAVQPPVWLSMDFGAGNSQVIDGYTIFAGNTQSENPRVWQFQGSDDNAAWTTIHSFSAATAIAASSSYSIASIGNIQPYRYYRVNVTANGGATSRTRIVELEMYLTGTTSLAVGGSFNFNTSGVTVTCDLIRQSVSNMMTVTHLTGDVGINIGSNINAVGGQTTISHTGSGNLVLTCPNLITTQNLSTSQVIGKSSSGLLTINGNLIFGNTAASLIGYVLQSTNGNTIINGNVFGNPVTVNGGGTSQTIRQTAGNLTINGNIVPTGIPPASIVTPISTVFFQGTTLTLSGNTLGGDGLAIVSTGTVNVIGNLNGGNSVYANSTIAINITGNTNAGLAPAVNASAFPNSTVNLTGNMYNNLGWNAIWCSNVFISNSATTIWRMDVGGGLTKTLYSSDVFPNLPATSLVRFNTVYGPSNTLVGTSYIPTSSNIRSGVIYDNGTVGTGTLTAQDIINYISSSSDSLAVRLRNILTVEQAGGIIKENNV